MPKKSKKFWGFLALLLVAGGIWGVYTVAGVTTTARFQGWEATHPFFAVVKTVLDGDTFVLDDGRTVRMLGTNSPERGAKGFGDATKILAKMIEGKPVWLEYDRYQDDKYGRLLAWVWIGCEGKPNFQAFDYMHLSNNESKPGLTENPEGCKEGGLVNEEMVRKGMAKRLFYKDRGELKYQKRLGG